MISFFLGDISFGSGPLTHPVGQGVDRQNTYAQYGVTRGKPVLHEIGEELDTQAIDFYFSEEFCNPSAEVGKLEAAFAQKTPLPLVSGNGVYLGKRYVVDTLSKAILHTSKSGGLVRAEATMTLLESPVPSLMGLISSIAKGRAPARGSQAQSNPNVRR